MWKTAKLKKTGKRSLICIIKIGVHYIVDKINEKCLRSGSSIFFVFAKEAHFFKVFFQDVCLHLVKMTSWFLSFQSFHYFKNTLLRLFLNSVYKLSIIWNKKLYCVIWNIRSWYLITWYLFLDWSVVRSNIHWEYRYFS